MRGIHLLKGTVKNYDWGGFSYLPALLLSPNEAKRPFAEYWMGTHPQDKGKLILEDGTEQDIYDFLQANHSGRLSYLLKILDVHDMLSIQVHPSKSEAVKAFARENAAGIDPASPERNYKDDNHKPELMVALSEFWLLHGFKPEPALRATLQKVSELHELLPVFDQSGYAGLYRHVMEMPQAEVDRLLDPLAKRTVTSYEDQQLSGQEEDFWTARAVLSFSPEAPYDRGIFSIYLFNLVHLQKGEGVFQDAGVPHAYLLGQNVEIMANSDNVLRGGLTRKHIDVKELLAQVKAMPLVPQIIKPHKKADWKVYETPATDFELSVFDLKPGEPIQFSPLTAEILVLTEGMAGISDGKNAMVLHKGQISALILPGQMISLSTPASATVYRASVPPVSGELKGA